MFEPTMGYAAFIYKAPYNGNCPKEYDILGEVDGEMLFLLYSEHQIQILISLQKPKVIEIRRCYTANALISFWPSSCPSDSSSGQPAPHEPVSSSTPTNGY